MTSQALGQELFGDQNLQSYARDCSLTASCGAGALAPEEAKSAGSNSDKHKPCDFVKSNADPLILGIGRSRLIHFALGVRRTAVSNPAVCGVVQIGTTDVLIEGKSQGSTSFMLWPSDPSVDPLVMQIRVEKKLSSRVR